METKLNKEQLKTLTQFIRKRGYPELDLQLEILDHFASKVEEILAKEPRLELSKAMQKAHASFGVMGFSTIADSYMRWNDKSLFRTLKSEFIRFMGSWSGQGLLGAYLISYVFLLGTGDLHSIKDLIEGFVLGLSLGNLLGVTVLLVKHWALRRKYMLFKAFFSFVFSFYIFALNVGLQFAVHIYSTDFLAAKWGLALVFLYLWITSVLAALFHRIIKDVVVKVESLEILTV